MRNGQKRMRGRNNNNNNNNHRKSQNPLTRVYESNGPDVKIRGTASHIAEKYIQLARDSQSSGDPVAAENYYQHAEHYFRLIAVAQEQFRQQNPYYNNQQPQQGQGAPQGAADDNFDDEGDDGQPYMGQNEPGFAPQPPAPQQVPQAQPYLPRDAQPFPPRDQQQHRPQHQPQQQPNAPQPNQGGHDAAPDTGGLPAFITGGGGQPQPNPGQNNNQGNGQNGYEQGDRQDRFGHRRRRRHRGGGYRPERPDNFGNTNPQGAAPQPAPGDGGGDEPPRQPE
ncbi:MAG TPA: DUF4167 domain-containing protein [Pseudolabrys sp.]|nr:DUF4167 domain-containing protein [Pseudolabrys sp.]